MKILTLSFMLAICFTMTGNSFHVKTTGTASGTGDENNPWNLQTALRHPPKVKAGDTILIHGGIYKGAFASYLRGLAGKPIIVKAVCGEEVILDGNVPEGRAVLVFDGQHTWICGLTLTTTDETRTNIKDGVYFAGVNNKLINCIIRNNSGNGIGFWKPAINSEVYGCIIYHNGTIGSTRGHGHGIYTQNETGTKIIKDNIIFNSFGIGIQVYSGNAEIRGYNIEGNTFFNCGIPYEKYLERHIIVGGLRNQADSIFIKSNCFYNHSHFPSKATVQLGYAADNLNAEFTDNYLINGSFYCMSNWKSVTVTDNTIMSSNTRVINFADINNIEKPLINNNTYYQKNLVPHLFNEWKNTSGQDAGSSIQDSTPPANAYFLRKNEYEAGRANLTIYNWENKNSVAVDVSSVLSAGDDYEVFDVSNLSGGSILSGKYTSGNISIPMQLTGVEIPFGNIPNPGIYKHTAPHLGVFLIRRSN